MRRLCKKDRERRDRRIRELHWKEGLNPHILAEQFGLTRASIYRILGKKGIGKGVNP